MKEYPAVRTTGRRRASTRRGGGRPLADPRTGRAFEAGERIAVALQGGGSHAAFCAGVLWRLLRQPDLPAGIAALSGTSGGALSAAVAWSWLRDGDPGKAESHILQLWHDIAVQHADLFDWWANLLAVGLSQSPIKIEGTPYAFPASWWADYAQAKMRATLRAALPGGKLADPRRAGHPPYLFIGATEILTGEARAISGDGADIEHILASAALPEFYQAHCVRNGNRWDGTYWDGLFALNPPVTAFLDLPDGQAPPDEIWVVRANPKARPEVPRGWTEIADRRNELAGNLSLDRQLDEVQLVNELVRDTEDNPVCVPKDRDGRPYQDVRVREIVLDGSQIDHAMDLASKLDRSPDFIESLIVHGIAQADSFLAKLPARVA